MNKAYERINWENSPSMETPLNEYNLNKIDLAVDILDNRILDLDSLKFDKSNAQKLVKSISFNAENGQITITYYDGSKDIVETFLDDADVLELQDNLIKHHAVVQKIADSDGNPILDSDGNEIYGKTVYADEADIVSIYNSLSAVQSYLHQLNAARPLSRLTEEEKKSEEMSADIAGLEQRITELETRMQAVEEVDQAILSSIESLGNSISTLSTSISTITDRLDQIQASIETLSGETDALRMSDTALSQDVQAIDQDLDEISLQVANNIVDFVEFKDTLAVRHTITLDLQDSSNEPLLDSSGYAVQARTVYAEQGQIIDITNNLSAVERQIDSINKSGVANRMTRAESNLKELNDHAILDNII